MVQGIFRKKNQQQVYGPCTSSLEDLSKVLKLDQRSNPNLYNYLIHFRYTARYISMALTREKLRVIIAMYKEGRRRWRNSTSGEILLEKIQI